MKTIYSFEPVLFKKMQGLLVVLSLVFVVLAFLNAGDSVDPFLFVLFSFLMTLVLVGVYYLNRNEISTLSLADDKVAIQYYNKAFFKRAPVHEHKERFTLQALNKGSIGLHLNGELIAVIRRDAVDEEQWKEICSYWGVQAPAA